MFIEILQCNETIIHNKISSRVLVSKVSIGKMKFEAKIHQIFILKYLSSLLEEVYNFLSTNPKQIENKEIYDHCV